MKEDFNLLNNTHTANTCEERKNTTLIDEIVINDSIIEDLQQQLLLHKYNITVTGIKLENKSWSLHI